jgi:hypothetical protein
MDPIMGREQDVTKRDVVKLLAIAGKIATENARNFCGGCLRARSIESAKDAHPGCPYCLARQVIASIAVRGLARKRTLNRKRANLRAVGKKIAAG